MSPDVKLTLGMNPYLELIRAVWDDINLIKGPDIFLETFYKVPFKAGLLYAAYWGEYEVCNGGFNQFFGNSTGVLAPEAVRGFQAIGQNTIADLVQKAMNCFGDEYPRDRAARQALLANFSKDFFDDLEEQFYALIHSEAGGFEAAADAYASSS